MAPKRRGHQTNVLIGLILVMLAYSGLLYLHFPLTGIHQLDGILGVLLGLYACTHPAANVIDLLFYARGAQLQGLSKQAYVLWWMLNGLVLLTGWMVISLSLLRFSALLLK